MSPAEIIAALSLLKELIAFIRVLAAKNDPNERVKLTRRITQEFKKAHEGGDTSALAKEIGLLKLSSPK